MLRRTVAKLGGHGAPSTGVKLAARVFNTTPTKVQAVAGDITALSPLIVVCTTGAIVCVGYMGRTLLFHPDIYLGDSFGRGDIIRDNQKHAREHHAHLARRTFTRDVTPEGGELQMQVTPTLNQAGGVGLSSRRHDPEALYQRALAEAKRIDSGKPLKSIDEIVEEVKAEIASEKKSGKPLAAKAKQAASKAKDAATSAKKSIKKKVQDLTE